MGLETNTDVDEIDAVQDRNGDRRPAADADKQVTANAELAEANQKLGNADAVFSDEFAPSTNGESLPAHSVAEGKEVLVYADPANGGIIYVGPTGAPSVPLGGGKGLTLQVTNTDLLDAQASEAGQTLHIIGEEGA